MIQGPSDSPIRPWQERAQHCPLCAAPLVERLVEERARLACSTCSFILYHGPAAASAALVVRDRDVLLVRRRIEPYRGQWGFPAGFQEYGETAEEAAVRETEEETGLRIQIRKLLALLYTTDDPRKRANLAVFVAHPVGGRIRPGDDCIDVRWFGLDELPDSISFVNNRRILGDLQRRFPEGPIRL